LQWWGRLRDARSLQSLIYKWRREARKAADAWGFAAVVVETVPPAAPLSAESTPEPYVVVVKVRVARVRRHPVAHSESSLQRTS
jgi:hypothetical protein